jgi:hypothetical protein
MFDGLNLIATQLAIVIRVGTVEQGRGAIDKFSLAHATIAILVELHNQLSKSFLSLLPARQPTRKVVLIYVPIAVVIEPGKDTLSGHLELRAGDDAVAVTVGRIEDPAWVGLSLGHRSGRHHTAGIERNAGSDNRNGSYIELSHISYPSVVMPGQ